MGRLGSDGGRAHPAASLAAVAALLGCRAAEAPVELASDAAGLPPELADGVGFDERAERGRAWEAGDRALYAVRLHEGERVREWTVGFRALPRPESSGTMQFVAITLDGERIGEGSPLHPVTATVLDHASGEASTSEAEAPVLFLQRGLSDLGRAWPHWEAIEASGRPMSADERRAAVRTMGTTLVTLKSVLELLQSVESLEEVLWAVLERPSWMSVALGLGVDLEIVLEADVHELAPDVLPPALRDRPVYSIPVTIRLNDAPALLCRILATTPDPPLALVAGVVRVEGTHPDDPGRRVELELLGARLADD